MVDVDACAHCNMIITQINQACGFFLENEFIPCDSPGCLLKEFQDLRNANNTNPTGIFFMDYVTSKFVHADSTCFLLTDNIPTVMNAGVLCFADEHEAKLFKKFPEEIITNWIGYQAKKGTPDQTIKIVVTPEGMIPEIVMVNKNEIIELKFKGKNLQSPIIVQLKGYEEIGDILLPISGESVTVRMVAHLPGAGFPFIEVTSKTPLGMIKVSGTHTMDEEAL
jgi:hypothetical protein